MASKKGGTVFIDANVLHTSIPEAILEDLCR